MVLRWRLVLILVFVAGGALPLLASGTAAQARGTTSVLAMPSASPASLQWGPCDDVPNTQCAELAVPLDPANPSGPQITLRLGRRLALDPARSKGVLLFIPGGPGVGLDGLFGGDSPARYHLDAWRHSFDVVSFDPRGVGESNPIRCDPALVPPVIAPFDRLPTPAEYAAIGRANAAFARSCVAATGPLMTHLSSRDTAADIERIRQALGQQNGLVAYASSYGTLYSQMYLEHYGAHVKALVLDGITDHSIDLPTDLTRHILSVQEAFTRFAQWCVGDPACALHGQDVGSVFDAAIATRPVVRTIVPQLLATGRDPQLGWPALAQMLAQMHHGDTAELDQLVAAASTAGSAGDPSLRAGKEGLFRGVECADFGSPVEYPTLAPRFAWKLWDATPTAHGTVEVGDCVGWPLAVANPPHPLRVGAHPNVLVANSAYDTSTPLANAVEVWLQIPQARLLIADVDGHQSLLWSRCAFETQFRFLTAPSSVTSTSLCPN